jgi:hypothetical protein
MKILKKGIVPIPPSEYPRVFRGKCPSCHCQIEIIENEPELLYSFEWMDFHVLCPTKGCPKGKFFVKEHITREIEDKSEVYEL